MNNIFVSSSKTTLRKVLENFTVENICLYLFKSYIKFDVLNNKLYENNISLKIEEKLLKNFSNKRKYFFVKKLLFNVITAKINKLESINLIYSNYFDKNIDIKEDVNNVFLDNLEDKFEISEIVTKNEMQKNDMKYIQSYMDMSKLGKEKMKILFVTSKYSKLLEEKLKEYVETFKYIDILKLNFVSKIEIKKVGTLINNINSEYGSNIEFITNKNLSQYNIVVYNIDEILDNDFLNDYILPKKFQRIDFENNNSDMYNSNVIFFNKSKDYLITLFNRLNLSYLDYSENKLGYICIKNLTNSI